MGIMQVVDITVKDVNYFFKVIYVIKATQSKTMKRISNVTGIIKANPHGYKMNGYNASSRYYCKRCELFF